MNTPTLVRASRDGDQFHYLWAARQCLKLLPGDGDLVAVTIEGASTNESSAAIDPGEQLIDVGLYYGSEVLAAASRVRYVQLKHSTSHAEKPWTASGLAKTLAGFGKRYKALLATLSPQDTGQRFRFEFTTNRPIAGDVGTALAALASGAYKQSDAVQQRLVKCTKLTRANALAFFKLFSTTSGEPNLWQQRNLLARDLRDYLPGADAVVPTQLKELVTRKATTEAASDPGIRRSDVLAALGVGEDELAPAPSLFTEPPQSLPREQEASIRDALLAGPGPLVIHADGGVGKSVLAVRLARAMPPGSTAILYDCFGNGLYRSLSQVRHRHREALVQIANELAAKALCFPLIPSKNADDRQYMRAFLSRLVQASELLRAQDPTATLCVIIDAADNAESAANERDEHSFVRDLIRERLPDGVRMAFTCRTHRRALLQAPPGTREIELRPFSSAETARYLRAIHPEATEAQVAEFAHQTSSNPRVQAFALEGGGSLVEVLRRLGPNPMTAETALDELLKTAVARVQDSVGPRESADIEIMCRGLAILRPLVPIDVLAKLSGVNEAAVRSFVNDLGRPLLLKGDSVHFGDEPSETWFRTQFQPNAMQLLAFLERLRPLAAQSAYAAAALPQLLLQAGKLDELVALALSDDGLPLESPLAQRDVKLQRQMFALKASLNGKRYLAAAKLALMAGGERAGDERQTHVLQANTDLTGHLIDANQAAELVARRVFQSTWVGSQYAYAAGLLSMRVENHAEAMGQLRMARDSISAWARAARNKREQRRLTAEDIAEMASAILRLDGPQAAKRFLRRWKPRSVAFGAGRLVARRLIDLGADKQLAALAEAASYDPWLLLGLAVEAGAIARPLPATALHRLMAMLGRIRTRIPEADDVFSPYQILDAVRAAIELALRTLPPQHDLWARILRRHLPDTPPPSFTSRFTSEWPVLLRAYALEAALHGKQLLLTDVRPAGADDQRVFEREAGGLLPWFVLSAEIACGRHPADPAAAIQRAREATTAAERGTYEKSLDSRQVIALEWLRVLHATSTGEAHRGAFGNWIVGQNLRPDTLIDLCRYAARADGFGALAMEIGATASAALDASQEAAEARIDAYLRLARAIVVLSKGEAHAYFNRGVQVASRIGDENVSRWISLLDLATAAADPAAPRPQAAYRLSRVAELTRSYVEDFPWGRTIEGLADLCGASALAIASRWRDRRFGTPGRILPALIEHLCSRGLLVPDTPIALAGVVARWNRQLDRDRVLATQRDPNARDVRARIADRYASLNPYGDQTTSDAGGQPELRETDWDAFFGNADVTNADTLASLCAELKARDRHYGIGELFRKAVARVPVGREGEFVHAVIALPDFGIFDLRRLIAALPSPLPAHLALRSAVRDAVLEACRRDPLYVRRREGFGIVTVEDLRLGGVLTVAEIAGAVLEGGTARLDGMSGAELFHIFDALAVFLPAPEAAEALDFGLDLLAEALRPEHGDGPWDEQLQPQGTMLDALAGYIWAGLGSPSASERWQHAHVVRAIVELDWNALLEALIACADAGDPGPFVDRGLAFYRWHARQWLLIGLARGALENPKGLGAARARLQRELREQHVLLRALAAQALRVMADNGELPGVAQEHLAVNQPLGEHVYDWGEATVERETEYDDDEYDFGHDIGSYWLRPLGEAFGLSRPTIERRTRSAIRQQLAWNGGSRLAEDQRFARRIFQGGETAHSQGDLPRADALGDYHAYHAMMIVAAQLVDERPVRRRKSELTDEFHDWVARYLLTRPDGKWLADARGPCPIDPRSMSDHHVENWRWNVTAPYLDAQLVTAGAMTVVWGEWHGGEGSYDEAVSVRSALVSNTGAEALLAALQTAPRFERNVIPTANAHVRRDAHVRRGALALAGWVSRQRLEPRLDEWDPWGNEVTFPGPTPSVEVWQRLGLVETREGAWECAGGGLLRRELWTQTFGSRREESNVGSERLVANQQLLDALFAAYPDHRMIASVSISRHPPSYARESGFESFPEPYVRFYLLGNNGGITTL